MALPLPILDDRRWADLVEEGRSLIPLHAPGWTDHNVHDPGITLMELLAWAAELELYRINRVPAAHVRKFLALAGVVPLPPRGARTVAAFRPGAGAPALPLALPADLELEAEDLAGERMVFRTLAPVTVVALEIAALQTAGLGAAGGAAGFTDLTARWRRGEPVPLLGDDPAPGAAFYIGFDRPLPQGVPVSLWIQLAGPNTGRDERERLAAEARRAAAGCPPPGPAPGCGCKGHEGDEREPAPAETRAAGEIAAPPAMPPHPSVRTAWEIQTAPGVWRRLDPEAGEVADDTRGLTLDGRVVVTAPAALAAARTGAVRTPLFYLRCRLAGGACDAAPALAHLAVNGVEAEQAEAVDTTWTIARGAVVSGPLPSPGEQRALVLGWNASGEIRSLQFLLDGEPRRRVLCYVAPTAAKTGRLTVETAVVGAGDGGPFQELTLPQAAVLGAEIDVTVAEPEGPATWTSQPDFGLCGRAGSHFVLDAEAGKLLFGDGEDGRRLPGGAAVWARYRATRGAGGNLPAGRLRRIAATPHNRALPGGGALLDLLAGAPGAIEVASPAAAAGGAGAEDLAAAAARAVDAVERRERAVTLADYEALALETPGVRLARVAARANLDPAHPCLAATGVVTVIVVPFLPRRRPFPSAGARQAVAAYLGRRRLLGTRIAVVGPTYLPIAVRAAVKALPGVEREALRRRVAEALDRFFHPLAGGPDGTGWPFGRDIYRSEVLQVLDEVPGVDHVLSLALLAGGCACSPGCGNVCVGPLGLVAAGEHEIEVR